MDQVLIEPVPLDAAFEKALNDRLVLVFTGKQRLARSDEVLRSRLDACLGDRRRTNDRPVIQNIPICLCLSLPR